MPPRSLPPKFALPAPHAYNYVPLVKARTVSAPQYFAIRLVLVVIFLLLLLGPQTLQSPALNLQLSPSEVAHLQELIQPDPSGLVPYAEFASRSVDIVASLYANQPPLEAHWVELVTADGSIAVNYNKQTGEVM